ncbi:hypothetical protein DQ04_05421000 [Trypanosoma grayi]|uniref:hypothetical protein n=1 Tax=Trypanosoma grayi TaxID=71804 RepID=UPI0004F4928B|nr:hypothetical protein DQ04_05421000 [Trypanosoma grayi]KEG09317.1 hypothetical protein DQ04_05421000 [Trypanosoma grayi]
MLRRVPVLGSTLLASVVVTEGAALVMSVRGNHHSRHDSNKEELASRYFDLQDIEVDRLTHHYWDDVASPYIDTLLLDEDFMQEDDADAAAHVLPQEDRHLLSREYLQG